METVDGLFKQLADLKSKLSESNIKENEHLESQTNYMCQIETLKDLIQTLNCKTSTNETGIQCERSLTIKSEDEYKNYQC